MTETPVVTARQFIRVLRKLGFVQTRSRGSIDASSIPMVARPPCQCIVDATFRVACCDRS